jgi:AcrR family transcriptional regulator
LQITHETRQEWKSKTLRSPLQARSRDTLSQILEAAKRLLEEKTFENISVAEIVVRANSSVGAFYARFQDKDALLDYLDEAYAREMIAFIDGFTEPGRWVGQSLSAIIAELIEKLVKFHRARRGLLRALILRARTRMEPRFTERTIRMNAKAPQLAQLLLTRRKEITHPNLKQAALLGFAFVFSALRERVLFPEAITIKPQISDKVLSQELTRLFLAYLGVRAGNK